MRRESRTISVLEGDWERWGDLAWQARMSVSQYIRTAVERANVLDRVVARASEAREVPGDTSEHMDALRDILEICGVEAYAHEQEARAVESKTAAGEMVQSRLLPDATQQHESAPQAESELHAQVVLERPVRRAAVLSGGAVKREAKAPHPREPKRVYLSDNSTLPPLPGKHPLDVGDGETVSYTPGALDAILAQPRPAPVPKTQTARRPKQGRNPSTGDERT